jgi:coenzyme Q-binding protein COQ10
MIRTRFVGSNIIFKRSFLNLPFANTNSSLQQFTVSKIVHAKACNIYHVVSGIDKYHEFIPFVKRSKITKFDNENIPVEGSLQVGWQQFDEQFDCKLVCQPNKSVVAESLSHSLFDDLYTDWKFIPLSDDITKVVLKLKFQFKNPLYNHLSSVFSKQVTTIMIKAFEDRINDLYNSTRIR